MDEWYPRRSAGASCEEHTREQRARERGRGDISTSGSALKKLVERARDRRANVDEVIVAPVPESQRDMRGVMKVIIECNQRQGAGAIWNASAASAPT